MENQHKVIIFVAPSGAGKTTLAQEVIKKFPKHIALSISATTRLKRPNETEAIDYYFISDGDFKQRISSHQFIEWAEVYDGTFYGTLKSEVDRIFNENKMVCFDVDVDGAKELKRYFKDQACVIFVTVPGEEKKQKLDELRKRLESRNTETVSKIEDRLEKAKSELEFEKTDYVDYVLVNEELSQAIRLAEKIVFDFAHVST